jgi:hypothetical protein
MIANNQVSGVRIVEPPALLDELRAQVPEVRDGPAERRTPEAQERSAHLEQTARTRRFVTHAHVFACGSSPTKKMAPGAEGYSPGATRDFKAASGLQRTLCTSSTDDSRPGPWQTAHDSLPL